MNARPKVPLALLVAALPLALQLAAVIRGIEDWPFTCAPMYAHYLSRDQPRYRFQLHATFHDGTSRPINAVDAGFIESKFWRLFFKHWYGTDTDNPFRAIEKDDPAQFRARLSQFFQITSNLISTRAGKSVETLTLSLITHQNQQEIPAPRLIGTYRHQTGIFEHREQNCAH